ncbi:response regulator [Spirosoma gilvum]
MKSPLGECVFLVDDDEDDRFLVQEVFKQYSPECRLKHIPDGTELLLALETALSLPTLILLDLNMPLMSGFEALRLIRQQPRYNAIPVVILTTSDQEADRQASIDLKADGFITKPVTVEGLAQVVLHLRQEWLEGICVNAQTCHQ